MSIFRKRKPFTYLSHRIRKWFDLGLYDVTRVIAGSPRAYGIDTSHWEGFFDPDLANHGLVDFAIFKATEGTTWVDNFFELNYDSAAGKVPVLGAYHYLRSGMDPRSQANHFLGVVNNKNLDILVCDFESINNAMDDEFVRRANIFGNEVKNRYPDAKVLFYTNPSTYDSVVYPACMRLYGKDVFTEFPWDGLWIAQYYFSPSPSKNPAMPRTRSDWVLWQYSEAGEPDMHGTEGWCDQNVFNGSPSDLHNWLGSDEPPPSGDTVSPVLAGRAQLTDGYRDAPRPFYFHELRFPKSSVKRNHVNGLGFEGAASYFYDTRGKPDIVINGGHADYSVSPPVPLSLVLTDGDFQKRQTQEFSIQFDQAGLPLGMFWGKAVEAYNVVGVSDRLLVDGAIPMDVMLADLSQRLRSFLPFVDDTLVDPRTGLFWNETEYIIIIIDGRNNGTQGLTRQEFAEFAKARGAVEGGNLDGGGSSSLLVSGIIKNNPPEGSLRSVANHIGFWLVDGGNMANGKAREKLGKTVSVRSAPAVRSGNKTGEIRPYSEFDFVGYVDDLDHPDDPQYTWVELASGGYANYIYPPNGVRLTILQEPGTEPPPPAGDISYFKSFDGSDNELDTWVREV